MSNYIEPKYNKKPMGFKAGEIVKYTSNISVIMADNPSPLTFEGTCTFLIGDDEISIIDPGPKLDSHYENIKKYLAGRKLKNIFVTHTHLDHSPLAMKLKNEFGASIYAYSAHPEVSEVVSKNPNFIGNFKGDNEFCPDICLKDQDEIDVGCGFIKAHHMPGHISNHLCFSYTPKLKEEFDYLRNYLEHENKSVRALHLAPNSPILFSGDHVMGWSSTVVIPPLGDMEQYLISLEKLLHLNHDIYLPAHGRPIFSAIIYVDALLKHRLHREAQIIDFLKKADKVKTIHEIVEHVYKDIPEKLMRAATANLKAHLDFLVKKNNIKEFASNSENICYIIGN